MRISLTLTFLVALLVPLHAQEAMYRMEAGKEYRYYLESSSSQIQEYMGQVMNGSQEVNIAAKIKVDEVLEDGSMKLTVTCESAMINSESPQGSESLGSDWGGKFVKLVLTSKGEVSDVDTTIAEADADAARTLIQLVTMFPTLDRDKLSVGNSWEKSKVDTAGSEENQILTESDSKFSIKNMAEMQGKNCYKIEVKTEADISGKLAQGNLVGTRESDGVIYYSGDDGLLVKLEAEVSTDQTLSLSDGNTRIPMSTSVTVSLELLK